MGMFDSFYFADGILPDNKVPAGYEFQTKSLSCKLDDYHVDSNGSVKKFVMNYIDGRDESIDPINDSAIIYSHEFLYDDSDDIMTRKHLGTRYQEYKIIILNSKVVFAEKIAESGFEGAE